ncbi:MAG TPA: hypothetical protein PLY87_11505, partial [Planctomycetaceae bacterium]|nr:hypothetical protein [Planctomycetaceae bacterium]
TGASVDIVLFQRKFGFAGYLDFESQLKLQKTKVRSKNKFRMCAVGQASSLSVFRRQAGSLSYLSIERS